MLSASHSGATKAKDLTTIDRKSSEALSIKIFPTLSIPRIDSSAAVYSKVSPEEHQYRYRRWTGGYSVSFHYLLYARMITNAALTPLHYTS